MHRTTPTAEDENAPRLDCFPYQHRLRELMTSPPLFVSPQMTLRDALALLIDNAVSSLYVRDDDGNGNGNEIGIVTERDLLRCIRRDDVNGFTKTVNDIATYPLLSLSCDAFVYRAVARLKRLRVRHLGVHDAHGEIIGAISARDLIRHRDSDAILLGDDIDAAKNASDMARVVGNLAVVARGLVGESVDGRAVAGVISREVCALTRQACKLAEAEMSSPPCRYALLVLGSGGRGESLLAMDQDNAIVYEDDSHDDWFAELGARVADILDAAGVPYCLGGVMARNETWRKSLTGWRAAVASWVRRKSPQDLLNCDIFFDAACVYGDAKLADEMLEDAFNVAAQSTNFLQLMAINACQNTPPLNWRGGFKLTHGRMDIKAGGIMPIFATARLLAIKNHIRARTTPARLTEVRDCQSATSRCV